NSPVLIFAGCHTGMPCACAQSFTGGAASSLPRPLGLSGWVTTATSSPSVLAASTSGTAKSGVPMKTMRAMRPSVLRQQHEVGEVGERVERGELRVQGAAERGRVERGQPVVRIQPALDGP